jgi:hypothetical protein
MLLDKNIIQVSLNKVKRQEISLFNLEKLIAATGNLILPVVLAKCTRYCLSSCEFLIIAELNSCRKITEILQRKLPDGQDMDVKRLSRAAGQGLEEIMNKVEVISKRLFLVRAIALSL